MGVVLTFESVEEIASLKFECLNENDGTALRMVVLASQYLIKGFFYKTVFNF